MRTALLLAGLLACGGPVRAAALPAFGHVVIVIEENHEIGQVIGNSDMPYLNSLANSFGLGTQYFADTHPSIGNYFMMTAGAVISNDDNFVTPVPDDNIVRELLAAGKTWKAYAESLPSPGFTGSAPEPYAKWHVPFSYFTDVVNVPAQAAHLVPFSQFGVDLANNALPQYSFIIPNEDDDAHTGSLAAADGWLKANIAPLLASPAFHHDGLLILTFDEGSSNLHGGGNVAWIEVSPFSKSAFQTATLFQHESTLRLSAEGLGLGVFPGASAGAPNMAEFFNLAADAVAPTAPTSVSLAPATPLVLSASWAPATDNLYVSDYLLDVSTASDFSAFATGFHNLVIPNIVNTGAFAAAGVAPGTTYFARLRAQDIAGNLSGFSATATGATPSVPDSVQGARAFPNPLRTGQGQAAVTVANIPAGASVHVFTRTGEKLKDLSAGQDGRAFWDATNEAGRPVASGVYLILVAAGRDRKTISVAVIR
jgi:acid phosphatase